GPLGAFEVPYIHLDDPSRYPTDSAAIFATDHLVGTLFSATIPAVSVALEHAEGLSKAESDTLVFTLRRTLRQFEFDELHMAGRVEGQQYYMQRMQEELVIFTGTAALLLIGFLYFAFRSGWGIWVPMAVVVLSAVWLLALMVALGKDLDLMMTLLPTILFVVGMSDVVHIISKYLEELRAGQDKVTAVKIAFREIGMATFLTSVTTAIGFLTLLTASIKPIREFGVFTAAGVFLAFILAFSLLPAILLLHKKPRIAANRNEKLFWYGRLHRLFGWVLRHRKRVLVGGVVLVVLCGLGINRVIINNYLLEDLSDSDSHKQDFFFFEDHFAGVRPFEVALFSPDSANSLMDYAALVEMEKVEGYLRDSYEAGFLVSPLSLVRAVHQATHGGGPAAYRLPDSEAEYRKLRPWIKRLSKRPEFQALA
ncbi:MAG: MMPL family transporter, partial [Bacteroidota bacterium]